MRVADRSHPSTLRMAAFLVSTSALGACSGTLDGDLDARSGVGGADGAGAGSGTGAMGGTAGVDGSGGSSATAGTGAANSGGTGGCDGALCGTACVQLQTDSEHCGSCTNACESNEVCEAGTCVLATCEGDLLLCDGECVDASTDLDNCGSCGNVCGSTFQCQGSQGCGCAQDRLECDEYCAHPMFDRAHCGDCNAPCAADQACLDGACGTIGIPPEAYCADTQAWPAEYTALEFEILDIVNRRRAEGASCGSEGYFSPAPPLQMDASLRCAARMHSKDMVERGFFDHTNPDGDGPAARMDAAGYTGNGWGENIAAGNSTAEQTMEQWMGSDGHCSNLMSDNHGLIGVGYYPGSEYGHYWTQNFGR